jgi:hypothetical protein
MSFEECEIPFFAYKIVLQTLRAFEADDYTWGFSFSYRQ